MPTFDALVTDETVASSNTTEAPHTPTPEDVAGANAAASQSSGAVEPVVRHLLIAGDISRATYQTVRQLTGGVAADAVIVWLETLGGSPNDGYRMMLELKHRFPTVAVVVANEAFSAGTMIALGADQLFMGPSAALGPLDMQIPHPERPTGRSISSLDVIRAMDAIEARSKKFAFEIAESLLQSRFGLQDAVAEGMRAASQMYRPLIEQIDPYLLHSSAQSLGMGIMYTGGLLASRRGMLEADVLTPEEALEVAGQLATQFTTHSHVIGRDELAGYKGLNPHAAEDLPLWDDLSSAICGLPHGGGGMIQWLGGDPSASGVSE